MAKNEAAEVKPAKEVKAKKAKEADPAKPKFNFGEYLKSPNFMVAIIFVVMMVVGGIIVYM